MRRISSATGIATGACATSRPGPTGCARRLAWRLNDAGEFGEPAALSWRQLHGVPLLLGMADARLSALSNSHGYAVGRRTSGQPIHLAANAFFGVGAAEDVHAVEEQPDAPSGQREDRPEEPAVGDDEPDRDDQCVDDQDPARWVQNSERFFSRSMAWRRSSWLRLSTVDMSASSARYGARIGDR